MPDPSDADEIQTRPANAEELKRWIETAFAEVPYPGNDHIATNPNHCDECREADDFFRGGHWRELAQSGERLWFAWDGLPLLSPSAWRFFLPAYMLAGLSGGPRAHDNAYAALVNLEPDGTGTWFEERVSGFSPAQVECLAAYCVAFAQVEPEDELWQVTAVYWRNKADQVKATIPG